MRDIDEPKVRWEEMFPDELRDVLARCPVCLVAYGLAEPHGPYNALGLDFLKAQALVERAAAAHGGVVAPPFCWHIQEQPHFDWLGSQGVTRSYASSLPGDVFYRVVLHQLRTFDARGFQAAILVTGHYGGLEADLRLLCEFYTRSTRSPLRLAAFADWELIHHRDYHGDHAGVCETSQLMALRPELVDLARTVETSSLGSFCGISFPSKEDRSPSRELGERIVRSQIEQLAQVQKELLAAYRPRPDYVPPDQNQVEGLWSRFERLTRKYWVVSLTLEEYRAGRRCEFPGWETLGL